MNSLPIALSRFIKIDVFKKRNGQLIDLKGWIANQNYYFNSLVDPTNFTLTPRDIDSVYYALSKECNRLAMASFETISGIKKEATLNRSGGWGAVRAYYAAYFSAHSFLRMFGISFLHLENIHLKKINEIYLLESGVDQPIKLTKGSYRISLDSHKNIISCLKMEDSHKGMWFCFLELIDDLILRVGEDNGLILHRKNEALDILRRIKDGISFDGCGNGGYWLSKFRNSINYQHTQGLWFPYTQSSNACHFIENMNRRWLADSSTFHSALRGNSVDRFFEVSMLITALSRELIQFCSKNVDQLSPVFSNGGIKLLNLLSSKSE
jgi:hypothetical protein